MRVVVPACGRGERFKKEGYETIKPKIPIAGEPMIDAVVRALSLDASDECVVVTNFDDAMDSERFKHVGLPRATVGATETVALALEDASLTPNTSSLLLVDCDAIYHCDVVRKFKALESRPEVRAAVLCFEESAEERRGEAKYSYVESPGDGGRVTRIAEKQRVGPYANTGAYWFASEAEFLAIAKDVVKNGKFEKGEAYVSCVLREYIAMKSTSSLSSSTRTSTPTWVRPIVWRSI
jgi:NDP-sugar pyrophosphorylase family protein